MNKSQQVTVAIGHAGVGTFQKVWACRLTPQNLFGFCFYTGQDKTKIKRFWLSLGGKAITYSTALPIAGSMSK